MVKKRVKWITSRNRSQGAIEFTIIFAVVLLFFVLFFSIIQTNMEGKNKEKENMIAQNVALDVQEEIDLAAQASEGYSRFFTVPENILGRDYQINTSETFVYIFLGSFSVSYKIPEINGSIQKGTNLIKKQNDTIYLNK